MPNQKKLVIISSSSNDLITHSLSTINRSNITIILLSDFLNSITLFDEITIDKTSINWQINNELIQNDHNTIILSLLFYSSLNIFDDFAIEDKKYALAETHAYLGFALNSFCLLNEYLDENGHEVVHPLPTQWNIIETLDKKYTTPQYYWGDYRFNHLQSKNLVYSDIYNFKKWCHHETPNDKMIFCFEKPKGTPYFSLVINNRALVTAQSEPLHLPIIEDIANLSIELSKQFHYFISESLYFYNEGKITIAFISPFVQYSNKNNQFDTFVHKNIFKALQS